jgi:hypothetical protein
MDTAAGNGAFLDADAFLRTNQSGFAGAWRYELVRGAIAAHAAPSSEHGVILGNLAGELGNRLRHHPERRPEVSSGAAPQYEQRDTARIPDSKIRCGQHLRVLFEAVARSELRHRRRGTRSGGPASR